VLASQHPAELPHRVIAAGRPGRRNRLCVGSSTEQRHNSNWKFHHVERNSIPVSRRFFQRDRGDSFRARNGSSRRGLPRQDGGKERNPAGAPGGIAMQATLENLRIDRTPEQLPKVPSRFPRWIAVMGGTLLSAVAVLFAYSRVSAGTHVRTVRAQREAVVSSAIGRTTILKSSGYVIAAHKIEVASKVMGRVAWIGVEKGEAVNQGQVLVKLENDEYRARVLQAEGSLKSLQAILSELQSGSRRQEIARAQTDFDSAAVDLETCR